MVMPRVGSDGRTWYDVHVKPQPRMVDVADLAGVAELAEELGMSKQSIANYAAGRARSGTGFPEPLVRLRATPIWSRKAVRAWFDTWEK